MTKPSMFLIVQDTLIKHPAASLGALYERLEEALAGLAPTLRHAKNAAALGCRVPAGALEALEQALAREQYEEALAVHNYWHRAVQRYVVEMRWSVADKRYVSMITYPRQETYARVSARESARALQHDLNRFADVDAPTSSTMLRVAKELGMPVVTLVCDAEDASAIPDPELREYRVYADAEGTYETTVRARSADEAHRVVGDTRDDEWEAVSGPSIGPVFKVVDVATGEEEDY